MTIRVRRFKTGQELKAAITKSIAGELLGHGGVSTGLMISGGETPKPVFQALTAAASQAGSGTHVLYSDERYVAKDASESNYNSSRAMLEAWGLPEERLLRIETEYSLEEAARRYHIELEKFIAGGGRITLGILGLGTDGHTCSLFTPEDLERGVGKWACAVPKPTPPDRISVTPALLEKVEQIVFWVAGEKKRDIAQQLLDTPENLVAGRAVAGCANVEMWTDCL